MQQEKLDFYLDNFKGMLEDVENLVPIDVVRMTSAPHAKNKIDEFINVYSSKEVRGRVANILIKLLEGTEILLTDKAHANEHLTFLRELKSWVKMKFPGLKIEEEPALTLNAKIILLNYLGVLDLLRKFGLNQKQTVHLLQPLLERDPDNIKEAIAHVNGKVVGSGVKKRSSLEKVLNLAKTIKSKELEESVQKDIDKLSQLK